MSRRRRNQTDARLVDEGRHWSEFFQAYWDAGAKAIFDMKAVGTHMPWYPYGVLEPDDRDKKALYGFFPKHIGKRIFGAMSDAAKKGGGQGPDGALRALDVGCGGGQMALEAARRGMYAVGFDIAVGALELARKHARAQGEQVDYIYADPMQLPFAEGAFDFLVCKDALHHLPAVRRVVENIWRVAAPGAPIVAYEHVADTEAGSKLRERLHQRHMPKIMARYGKTEKIPEVIRSTSVNEDIGAAHVGPAVREWFDVEYERAELRMYLDIEQIYYFRYGKKRWLAKLAGTIARLSERLNRKGIEPEFLLLIGKRKENKN